MKLRITLATLSVLLGGAVGCAERTEPAPTQRHPANPTAAEAPAPAASNTLKPDLDPDGAAPGGAPAPDALVTPAAYTCAHHPREMHAEPGECPTCGMPLEPTTSKQTSPLRQRNDLPEAGTPEEPEDDAETDDAPPAADEPGGQG